MKRLLGAAALLIPFLLAPEARALEAASVRLTLMANDWDLGVSDFGTSSHLGIGLRTGDLGSGFRADADLSLRVLLGNEGALQVVDNASYLRMTWKPQTWGDKEAFALTVMPITSTRLHLGYEPPASWGRRILSATGTAAPAVELRLTRDAWYAFAAAKSALGFNDRTHENERLNMLLAGAGVDALPQLRFELAAMMDDEGQIPLTGHVRDDIRAGTVGVSGRVLFRHGDPIAPSVDLDLYWSDPEVFERQFAPETYSGTFSASVSLEASHYEQQLANPDELMSAGTELQGADVAALQSRFKFGQARAHLLAMYRSMTATLPSLGYPPYQAFGDSVDTVADLLLSGGVDYQFAGPRLTPGIIVFVERPAAFSAAFPQGGNSAAAPSVRWVVVGRDGRFLVQPEDGTSIGAVVGAKATLRWDAGNAVSVLGEVSWMRDPNRTVFRDTAEGMAVPDHDRADVTGFAAMLQGRF